MPWLLISPLKSPVRIATVGTYINCWLARRSENRSYAKKKKERFRPSYTFGMLIGPPTEPPNSFRISFGATRFDGSCRALAIPK